MGVNIQMMDTTSLMPGIKMVMNSIYGVMNDALCLDTTSQMKYLSDSDFDRNDETYNMTMQDMRGFNEHNLPVDNIRSKESLYFELFIKRESHSELDLDEIFSEVTEDYNNDDLFEDEIEYLLSPIYSFSSSNPRLHLCGDCESDYSFMNIDHSYNRTILEDSCKIVRREKEAKIFQEVFNRRLQSKSKGSFGIYKINIV